MATTTTNLPMAVMLKCTRKEIEKTGREHSRALERLFRFANEIADAANYGAGVVETNLTQTAAEVATLTAKLRTLQETLQTLEEVLQAEAEFAQA